MTEANCWEFAVSLAQQHRASAAHDALEAEHQDVIYQVSTLTALLEAVLDGDQTYGEIKQHGDFGVGTFDGLDGEMVALDGEFYQLHAGGAVTVVTDDQRAPFAAVTFFDPQAEIDLTGPMTLAAITDEIDATITSEDEFFAIRIDGTFASLLVRCPLKQQKPYPSLAEAAKTQVEVTLTDVTGSIIGFRSPQSSQGTAVAGYHLHFINDARTSGGHVLACELTSGVVTIDRETDFQVHMPRGAQFKSSHLSQAQIDAMIEASEQKS